MNEFELIKLLTTGLPRNDTVVAGPGDDCAIIKSFGSREELLLKTDAVVEGVHFETSTPPEKVGHKALARVLSDIAAMAGTPVAALVTIGLPRKFDPEHVRRIYDGMARLAERHQVAIVGGETTTNPERVLISVALLGRVKAGQAALRSSARQGDAIFVSGELGGSITSKHLDFEPRLEEGRWLTENFELHAMIDLSDGLAGDLKHIINASGVGAELLGAAIPISRAAKEAARKTSAKPALVAALTDGEDFELLFTVPSRQAVPLMDAWKARFSKLRLSCIGKITADPGILLRDKTGVRPLTAHGYTHFA
jgi:thiamine-monophosphate kinase